MWNGRTHNYSSRIPRIWNLLIVNVLILEESHLGFSSNEMELFVDIALGTILQHDLYECIGQKQNSMSLRD